MIQGHVFADCEKINNIFCVNVTVHNLTAVSGAALGRVNTLLGFVVVDV